MSDQDAPIAPPESKEEATGSETVSEPTSETGSEATSAAANEGSAETTAATTAPETDDIPVPIAPTPPSISTAPRTKAQKSPALEASEEPVSTDPTAGIPTGGLLREQPATEELTGDEKLWGLLANLLGPLGAVLAFLVQGQSKFVKFNALQMIFLCAISFPAMIVLGFLMFALTLVPFFGGIMAFAFAAISPLMGLILMLLCVIIGFKAHNGLIARLPVIGDMAYRSAYGETSAPRTEPPSPQTPEQKS